MKLQAVGRSVMGLVAVALLAVAWIPQTAGAALMASSGTGARSSAVVGGEADRLLETAARASAPEPDRAGGMAPSRGSTKKRASARPSAEASAADRPRGADLNAARGILAKHVARHPILKGTTVEFGDARGYQAISYYQSARIVIDPDHRASLERIIGHEVWHIIDWRDNGRIDWGENVPPR